MVRVACTLMQKNETALIDPWLKYHCNLFGYENIYVFDNGSHISSVVDTLDAYKAKGIHLSNKYSTVADYALKGEIITDCILHIQENQTYDVVVPLDCDEFLVLKDGQGATTSHQRIMAHMQDLTTTGGLFRVDQQLFNIIGRPGQFGIGTYTKTIIVPDGSFVRSDHGHHFCLASGNRPYSPCNFAYVHYHYKPLAMLREHARAKLAPFVDVENLAAVASFTGAGHHLRPYLTMTEEEFANWHGGDQFYQFREFNERLAELGASIPF